MAAIDTHAWLQAIDSHPDTSGADLLTAYDILGVSTDIAEAQLDASILRLQLSGFLRVADIDGDTWTHEIVLPACSADGAGQVDVTNG